MEPLQGSRTYRGPASPKGTQVTGHGAIHPQGNWLPWPHLASTNFITEPQFLHLYTCSQQAKCEAVSCPEQCSAGQGSSPQPSGSHRGLVHLPHPQPLQL